ncbi:MAG: hypothetical protein KBG84_04055 [Planctomycetes bacterium]|nr:hypothetical protein [Planctomycetota bacterium]
MPYVGAQNAVNQIATPWLVENDPEIIQVHGHWAWQGVPGGLLTYARVPKLIAASAAGACLPIKDHSDEATQVQFGMVEYATRVVICNADEDTQRGPNTPELNETVLAEIKCDYGYYARMDTLTGDPVHGGLLDLVAPGNIINPGGAPLSFPCLEAAFDKITGNNNRPSFIMSNLASRASYRNLCWATGIKPPEMPWRWYDPLRGWQVGKVTTFHGVPWLVNTKMNAGLLAPDRRIYFIVMGDDGGKGPTRGLTGIRPADMMNRPYVKRAVNGVPDFANAEVNMARNIWLTMPAGLALGSQGCLSILTNFANVGECTGIVP